MNFTEKQRDIMRGSLIYHGTMLRLLFKYIFFASFGFYDPAKIKARALGELIELYEKEPERIALKRGVNQ